MQTLLFGFATDKSGTAVIEYGLVAGFISVAYIGAMTFLGNGLLANYTALSAVVLAAL